MRQRVSATTSRSSPHLLRACRAGSAAAFAQPTGRSAILSHGRRKVIVGSALFRDGAVDVTPRSGFATPSALDDSSRRSTAVADESSIHGWRTQLPITAVEAVRALEPFVSEFLYTHVDSEGLMQGTDMAAIRAVQRRDTRRRDGRRRHHDTGRD